MKLFSLFISLLPFFSAYSQGKVNYDFFSLSKPSINRLIDSVRSVAYPIAYSLPHGYVKDGSVDYRYYVQKAIDEHAVVAFPPFPVLINDSGITLHSDQFILFPPGSQIRLLPSSRPSYEILRVFDAENTAIFYPHIAGDAASHLGHSGEWGMGISVRGARNIFIYHPNITYCWGDGIYIGDEKIPFSKKIRIIGGNIANNRRNGISVISVDSLLIDSTVLTHNMGTWPKAGIDIEPNTYQNVINHIYLNHIHTNNNYAGIIINLNALNSGIKPVPVQIYINQPFDSASQYGLWFVKIQPNKLNTNLVQGNIQVSGGHWLFNKQPVLINEYLQQKLGPNIALLPN
ncbi:right-handed parallel beta-helix repeat-containing protein [Thermoflavifilum thermophilum]|uniref:Uncharacterized protein n=1 Tax=Thermoflavifilum thermophilum TaxID=1393122 RepID=A0A1I7MY47_9BACT|nr:right-handed parallel beta-helix repeat-containing protein [Thermoflavifilum thermophilum]SFV27359.1 hypothetical protein SAMN05660895_0093 [Thermoflavifilum thermophilum]